MECWWARLLDSRKAWKMEKMKGCYLVDLLDSRKVAMMVKKKEKYLVDSMGLTTVVAWEQR